MTCSCNFSSICTWICHCLNTLTAIWIRTRYICSFNHLKFQILLIIQSERSCSVIFSYPCSIRETIPPPLFFPRIKIFFTFISVMEGSKRGTAMQNRPSWAGTSVPEGDFFFCPWRNFNRPWNCIVWNETETNDNWLKLNICSRIYANFILSSMLALDKFLFFWFSVHYVAQSKFSLASNDSATKCWYFYALILMRASAGCKSGHNSLYLLSAYAKPRHHSKWQKYHSTALFSK